jgi:D-threo-aldose 1-dehydrogenase
MKITSRQHRQLGTSALRVPPIVFGTAALANVPRVIPEQRKLAICGEWFRHVEPPLVVDVADKHGNGMALELLGRMLRGLDVTSDEVVVHLTIDSIPVVEAWEKSCRLLGEEYRPKLLSVCRVDEWREASGLKASGLVRGIGIATSNADELNSLPTPADWVVVEGSFTSMHHPPGIIDFMVELADRQIPIVVSRLFAGGFLVGGSCLDGRTINADDPANRSLFAWRKSFAALCHGHGVSPAQACIQFALAVPSVVAVRLESSSPERVAENVEAVLRKVPDVFWASMKEERLLSEDYPHLGI